MTVPKELMRKTMYDHADFSTGKFKEQKKLYLGALKYIPHAIFKVLENMPMPWQNIKTVKVVYHVTGAVSFIDEVPKVCKPIFIAQWGTMWTAMRIEKRDRPHFKRLRLPPFDDEEPIIDYTEHLMNLNLPDPIRLNLDKEEEKPVYNWLYDDKPLLYVEGNQYNNKKSQVNGPSYRSFKLTTEQLSCLHRLSTPILSEINDKNYFYLFDLITFVNAKALNLVIPGGPRFEPLYRDEDADIKYITEFNDINLILYRKKIRSEYCLAFPHLYNLRPRSILASNYLHLPYCLVKSDDYYQEPFTFDKMLNAININVVDDWLISPYTDKNPLNAFKKKNFKASNAPVYMPDVLNGCNIKPFLRKYSLSKSELNNGLNIYTASSAFSSHYGVTKPAHSIPIISHWYKQHCDPSLPVKIRVSYQKLLKNWILTKVHHEKSKSIRKRKLIKLFKRTKFFETTETDWLEVALNVCKQGHTMLVLLIHKRNLTYLHLDYNFNLKSTKTLTTKERKKSRLGNAFHICREILKLLKLVTDAHVQFRLGNIDAYQLADILQYIFNHVGHVTSIYRYKYRVMRQVRQCKDLKHVIYNRFNANSVGKGPGVGFWVPSWRVWLFFLKGIIPLLEDWLGNLLGRTFHGRASNSVAKTMTKQRIESYYNIELRAAVVHDLVDMMPQAIKATKTKVILQHLSEAWRCWKANLPWKVEKLPKPVEVMILRYVQLKANWWINNAYKVRNRIKRGAMIDKAVCKKNLGKLARLWMRAEQDRQQKYITNGPYISSEDAVKLYNLLINWLDARKFKHIPFPPIGYRNDVKLLTLALNRLKETYSSVTSINQSQRAELNLIETAYENPNETISKIKRYILTQKSFKDVNIDFVDSFTTIQHIYEVDPFEKIVDAYLDQYMWYEAEQQNLFPPWIKPSDNEPNPLLAYKFCSALNNLKNIWNCENDESMVLIQSKMDNVYDNIDLTLLNKLLRLIFDHNIADYITSKYNAKIWFKDMYYINYYGILLGLQFSGFVSQLYLMVIDLVILGPYRALDLCNAKSPSASMVSLSMNFFENEKTELKHPIRGYLRYLETFWIILKLSKEEAESLTQKFTAENSDPQNENLLEFNLSSKLCWPASYRMRQTRSDSKLGNAAYSEIIKRVPYSIVKFEKSNAYVSIYSKDNPNILFEMCGFEIRILPKCREQEINAIYSTRSDLPTSQGGLAVWSLLDQDNQVKANAYLKISKAGIQNFENRIRNILISTSNATFTKVSSKWNTALLTLVAYYREAIVSTEEMLELLIKSENKIQNRIKLSLNSKMPNKFPPVVFYAPRELGGLGMLSMGHILIPAADLKFSKQADAEITHFKAGLSGKDQDAMIPNIYRYINSWESEFEDSITVWEEYSMKRRICMLEGRKLSLEDVNDIWDRGLPRINTLFQVNSNMLSYDKGWRLRGEFKQYQTMKWAAFYWTNQYHDGKLWNLNNYRMDVIQALGGIDCILEHSLFAATYFKTWEGLFWERSTGFEESMKYKKLTNAQKSGLNQIPNRRFALWWGPTINRANVYIGFQVQLDLTGIFMHGKIPTLKICLIQIFRAHLWQKIHESLVMDICQVLDFESVPLQIYKVKKQTIHPRKSYKMNSSCADIVLEATTKFNISKPTQLSAVDTQFPYTNKLYWIDIQLRWGDYDSHNIEKYTKSKFIDYTTDNISMYNSEHGVIIGVDLAYNIYSSYGNYFTAFKPVLQKFMKKIIDSNPALYVLRERIRKSLHLYSSSSNQIEFNLKNITELFTNKLLWIIDDTNVYRVAIHRTIEGNLTTKPVNGAIITINPMNGQLFFKIIHTSVWEGQKRLSQLSKWKAAEEIAAHISSLPVEEQPKEIVVIRKRILDPLEVHLIDFPNIIIKSSEFNLPFFALLKVDMFSNLVINAKKPEMLLFNLYDDWLKTVSPQTAFVRLVIILKSLSLDKKKSTTILYNTYTFEENKLYIWPKLTDDQWTKVEVKLTDLIINNYATTNNINKSMLIQSEIRDIILGANIPIQTMQKQHMDEIDKPTVVNDGEITAITTKTTNVHGDQIIITTHTDYEKKEFDSSYSWRKNLLASMKLYNIGQIVEPLDTSKLAESSYLYNFPKNLLKIFVSTGDMNCRTAAYIYGEADTIDIKQINIKAFIFAPQTGDSTITNMNTKEPIQLSIKNMNCYGIIQLVCSNVAEPTQFDLSAILNITEFSNNKNSDGDYNQIVLAFILVSPNKCSLIVYEVKPSGFDWINKKKNGLIEQFSLNFFAEAKVSVTSDYQGFTIVPYNDIWNYNYNNVGFSSQDNIIYKISTPVEFHHELHRTSHFMTFAAHKLDKIKTNLEEVKQYADNDCELQD